MKWQTFLLAKFEGDEKEKKTKPQHLGLSADLENFDVSIEQI